MRIGLISKREKAHKTGSVMQAALQLLAERGVEVETIYPEECARDVASIANAHDLYLLKSGTEMALGYARVLHESGAKILNPYPTVSWMRDKIASTKRLLDADVPLPETWFAADPVQLAELLADGPLVVKPFWAASQGRGVQVIRRPEDLAEISVEHDIVFAQRYQEPDGRDYKLYVIGDQVFGVRRVWPPVTLEDKLGEPFEVPHDFRQIALRCGRAFGVGLYGVDIVTSRQKPFVVDINSFPGYKGVPNAGALLAEHILNHLT